MVNANASECYNIHILPVLFMYYRNTEGNEARNIFAPRIKSRDYCLFDARTYIIHSVILKTSNVMFLLLLFLFVGTFNSGTKSLSTNTNHLTWYSIKDVDCSGFCSTLTIVSLMPEHT